MNIAMVKFPASRWLLVATLALGAVVLAANPGHAQTDQRFFGVWQPASTSAGGNPLKFEPGRITYWNKDELTWDQRYEVIRDFGERIVVKIWTVKVSFDYPLNEPGLEVYTILQSRTRGPDRLILSEKFCSSDHARKYFFQTDDKEEIWQRVLAWSAHRDEGFPYDDCILNEDGSFPHMWSGAGFTRDLNKSK